MSTPNDFLTWLYGVLCEMGKFFSWLVNPIEGLNIAPLAIFGIAGFTLVFGLHVVHLIIG